MMAGLLLVAALLLDLLLRRLVRKLGGSTQPVLVSRLLLALRSTLLVVALPLVLSQAIAALARLPSPLRWIAGALAGLAALPWLGNAVAGLWFLARLGKLGVEGPLTVAGFSGRVSELGVTRLTLRQDDDRIVHLPYLSLLLQPLTISTPGTSPATQIVLQRDSWSEEARRFLLQASVLSPYRDVTAPVAVTVAGSSATVVLSLVRPEALEPLQRLLEQAVDQWLRERQERQPTSWRPPAPGTLPPPRAFGAS